MKRRGFLKFIGFAAAAPVMSPLAEKCMRAKQPNPVPEAAWEDERRITNEMDAATHSVSAFDPSFSTISYAAYADAGRMPTYEGFVYANGVNRLWRFDVVRGNDINFKCRNCGMVMAFNRQDFREHGQQCNALFGEQS